MYVYQVVTTTGKGGKKREFYINRSFKQDNLGKLIWKGRSFNFRNWKSSDQILGIGREWEYLLRNVHR